MARTGPRQLFLLPYYGICMSEIWHKVVRLAESHRIAARRRPGLRKSTSVSSVLNLDLSGRECFVKGVSWSVGRPCRIHRRWSEHPEGAEENPHEL